MTETLQTALITVMTLVFFTSGGFWLGWTYRGMAYKRQYPPPPLNNQPPLGPSHYVNPGRREYPAILPLVIMVPAMTFVPQPHQRTPDPPLWTQPNTITTSYAQLETRQ